LVGPADFLARSSLSDLKGEVAVVTGASKRIGAATAKGLSAAGAAVVVNYSSRSADNSIVSPKLLQARR
jgi:3-oxoacyl-[acyl-carrier protein] reductase